MQCILCISVPNAVGQEVSMECSIKCQGRPEAPKCTQTSGGSLPGVQPIGNVVALLIGQSNMHQSFASVLKPNKHPYEARGSNKTSQQPPPPLSGNQRLPPDAEDVHNKQNN